MANTIKHKQSSVADKAPIVGDLVQGELAINTADGKLYTKNSSNVIIEIGGNVADASSVAAAGAVMEGDTTTALMQFVVDQDDMNSNSATKVCTQQSVKAYVDTKTSKLDGIETNADVTDSENVAAAGAVMDSDTTTAAYSFVIDEDDMSSNSSTKVPTQQSVKAYIDAQIAAL